MQPEVSQILIVDDEEPIRELLRSALTGETVAVATAGSGEEALRRVDQGGVDLVLTDLKMPGMSGDELTVRLAEHHPEVGVVMMTGFPSLETARVAVRAGVLDYLEKPFENLDALRRRIGEILEIRRQARRKAALLAEMADKNRSLQDEKALLLRKVGATQRNLREQMRSLQRSRETFYSDLARVMAILDNLVDGIVFTDATGKIILANPSAGKMVGIPPFAAVGRSVSGLEGNRPLLSLLAAHRTLDLGEDGVLAEISTRFEGKDGHYSVHSSPIPDFQGKLSGILSLIRDVSLRKKTEHLKNQFLSIVAHELRTPLTTIKAFATILDKGIYGALPEEQQNLVTNILAQSDRLGHEIDKVISLGRLEASDFAPDLAEVAASKILTKIAGPFEAEAREKSIDFSVKDDSNGAVVWADGTDVQRALRALVENALKFTPEGGTVVVHAGVEDDSLVFEVRDDGIGIAPQDHEIIFERFIQLENPLTRKHGGSGLGLSFAAEILRAHSSHIEVESDLGKGAVFRFRLPLAERMRNGEGPATLAGTTGSGPTIQRQPT